MKLINWLKRLLNLNQTESKDKPQLSLSDVEQAYVGDKKSKEYISLIDNLRLIIRQKK